MINIRPDQHAKILGFAILGYGIQVLPDLFRLIGRFWSYLMMPYEPAPVAYVAYELLVENHRAVLIFVVSMLAGLSLLAIRSKSKIPSLIFALSVVSFFPLGTILSFYVLYYQFAVRDQEGDQ